MSLFAEHSDECSGLASIHVEIVYQAAAAIDAIEIFSQQNHLRRNHENMHKNSQCFDGSIKNKAEAVRPR